MYLCIGAEKFKSPPIMHYGSLDLKQMAVQRRWRRTRRVSFLETGKQDEFAVEASPNCIIECKGRRWTPGYRFGSLTSTVLQDILKTMLIEKGSSPPLMMASESRSGIPIIIYIPMVLQAAQPALQSTWLTRIFRYQSVRNKIISPCWRVVNAQNRLTGATCCLLKIFRAQPRTVLCVRESLLPPEFVPVSSGAPYDLQRSPPTRY